MEKNEMKTVKAAPSSVDAIAMSIPDAEEMIEEALNELAFSADPGLVRALRFLAPPGYQAIVELCGESGRSKRRNASAGTWSPEEDEVRIYFERIEDGESAPRATRSPRPVSEVIADDDEDNDGQEAVIPADLDARVKELCAALAKTPAYPTTTIRLNRAEAGIPEEAQRFHPVALHGDSIAEAIEEERGNL